MVIGSIHMTREDEQASFDCSVNEKDGCTVVRPRGWVDAFAAPDFRQVVAGLPLSPPVVIDMSQVNFIDSAGLGVLVSLLMRARQSGSVAVVAVPARRLRCLLNDVGFGRIAILTDSPEDAAVMLRPAR